MSSSVCEWYCGCFTNVIGLIFHIPPVPFDVCVLQGRDIGAYSVYYSAVEKGKEEDKKRAERNVCSMPRVAQHDCRTLEVRLDVDKLVYTAWHSIYTERYRLEMQLLYDKNVSKMWYQFYFSI